MLKRHHIDLSLEQSEVYGKTLENSTSRVLTWAKGIGRVPVTCTRSIPRNGWCSSVMDVCVFDEGELPSASGDGERFTGRLIM